MVTDPVLASIDETCEEAPVIIRPMIGYAEHGDRAVLLNPLNDHYYGLDEIGIRVWQMLNAGASAATVCSDLVRCYHVPASDVARDLRAFLNQLREAGLIL